MPDGPHPIGILMLDTNFPRPIGDIGNPDSFDGPVIHHVIPDATVDRVVADGDRTRALLPAFIAGARTLEAQDARLITTSCGFLAAVQPELAASVSIPVVTSSLLMAPMLCRIIGSQNRLAIVTADATALSEAHLRGAGISPDLPVDIIGMEGSDAFRQGILDYRNETATPFDPDAIGEDLMAAGRRQKQSRPGTGAYLLECTNLQPHAVRLRQETGLPVFGIMDLLGMMAI